MSSTPMNNSPRRPRPVDSSSPPQFGLRGLFIFTAAAAVLFALLRCLDVAPGELLQLLLVFGGVTAAMIALLELFRAR